MKKIVFLFCFALCVILSGCTMFRVYAGEAKYKDGAREISTSVDTLIVVGNQKKY